MSSVPPTSSMLSNTHALPPRAWTPPPLIALTVILHLIVLVLLLAIPQHWRLLLALLIGNHLLLCAAVLWPRGRWLGANLTRLPPAAAARGEIALTLDDGPDPAI